MHQLAHFIFPTPIATRIVNHLPAPELVAVVWEFRRGCCEKKGFIERDPVVARGQYILKFVFVVKTLFVFV